MSPKSGDLNFVHDLKIYENTMEHYKFVGIDWKIAKRHWIILDVAVQNTNFKFIMQTKYLSFFKSHENMILDLLYNICNMIVCYEVFPNMLCVFLLFFFY